MINQLQTTDILDLKEFIELDNEIETIYKMPSYIQLDIYEMREYLIQVYEDVIIQWTRGEPYYLVTVKKKQQCQIV